MARLWLLKDCLSLKLWGINLGNIGVLWKMDWILLLMLVPLLMFSVSENVISYWEFLWTLRLQGCLQVDLCSWMPKFPVPQRKWNLAKLSTDPIFISITNAQQLQVWYFSFTLSPVCVLLKSRGWSVEKEQSFSGLCFVIESFFLSLQFPCINLSKYLT